MNFKGTTNFYNFLSLKKSCYKSVKLYCYYSTQKYDDSLTQSVPWAAVSGSRTSLNMPVSRYEWLDKFAEFIRQRVIQII